MPDAGREAPWQAVRGLFPKWDPTVEESALYQRTFGSRNATLMKTAIENFRIGYRYREPHLGGILKEYGKLVQNRNNSHDRKPKPGEVDDPEYVRKVEADNAKILHDLELLTEEQLSNLRKAMSEKPGVSSLTGSMTGGPDNWSRTARGLSWVLADEMGMIAGSLLSDRLPSLSQDQG